MFEANDKDKTEEKFLIKWRERERREREKGKRIRERKRANDTLTPHNKNIIFLYI